MKKHLAYLYYFLLLFTGCTQYDKVLKSTDYDLKYRKAFEYYHKEDYTRASTLFEQIVNVYRGSLKGDSINFYLADSYFKAEDFMMASEYFKLFAETYTRSAFAEKAFFLKGFCFYKLSPRPELDQAYTKLAIEEFSLFTVKYPKSEYIPECKRLSSEMQEKIVEKSYLGAKLYFNLGRYNASIVALRNSLADHPETKHREELKYLLMKGSFLYADNSVIEKRKERFQNALDEYYSFVDEFPNSKFKKEADKLYQQSLKVLGNEANKNNS